MKRIEYLSAKYVELIEKKNLKKSKEVFEELESLLRLNGDIDDF